MAKKTGQQLTYINIPFTVAIIASISGSGTANVQVSQFTAPVIALGLSVQFVNLTFKNLDGLSIVYMGTKSGKTVSTGFHEYASTLSFHPNSVVGTNFVVGGSARCLRT
jgi:type VI protein secretion system component Hcp